jgi:hypothetical protein
MKQAEEVKARAARRAADIEAQDELFNRQMVAQEQERVNPRQMLANNALQWMVKDTGALGDDQTYFDYGESTWDPSYVLTADEGRLARRAEAADRRQSTADGYKDTYMSPPPRDAFMSPQGGGAAQSWQKSYNPTQHKEIQGFLDRNPGDESRIGSALGFKKLGGASGNAPAAPGNIGRSNSLNMGSLVAGNRNNSDLVRRPQVDPRPESYRPQMATPSPRRETAAAPGLAQQDVVRNIRAQQQNRDQEYRNAAAPDPLPWNKPSADEWREFRASQNNTTTRIPEEALSSVWRNREAERQAMMARGDRQFQNSVSNYRNMGQIPIEAGMTEESTAIGLGGHGRAYGVPKKTLSWDRASPEQIQEMQQMRDRQMREQQIRGASPQQIQQMQRMRDEQMREQQMRGGQFRGSLPQVPRGLSMAGLANPRWRA